MSLSGKKILIGVTGGIAAYKAAELVRLLKKRGAEVCVTMTPRAVDFITPLTLAALSGNKVLLDFNEDYDHLLSDWDLCLLYPATANTIARLAAGLAAELLETVVLAAKNPVWICPAMNSAMLFAPAVQDNLALLRARGLKILDSDYGALACGEEGWGRLPEPETVVVAVEKFWSVETGGFAGKKVLITAGPTREYLDEVRFFSNVSTGKSGDFLAAAFLAAGAEVTLLSGATALASRGNLTVVFCQTGAELADSVKGYWPDQDFMVGAAAVTDLTFPSRRGKIPKAELGSVLKAADQSEDILAYCGKNKRPDQVVVGFSLEETPDLAQTREKCALKGADLLVVNFLADLGGEQIEPWLFFPREDCFLPWIKQSKNDFSLRLVSFLAQRFVI